jgi:peptidoglycan-associated lipoprotein
MRLKFLTLLAAAALLTACESSPDESAATTSSGTAASSGSGSGTSTAALPGLDPRSQEWLVVNVGDRVFFDFDKSDLTPEAQDTVEKVVAWLKTYPDVTLTVEGHCDERGTREYNLALGERRANAVTSYMVALGIDANRVANLSFGKERPAVRGSNEAAWAQNRRGVFIVN